MTDRLTERDLQSYPASDRLVAEVRRLRWIITGAAPYAIPSDAFCAGCLRTYIGHDVACPIGALEAEANAIEAEEAIEAEDRPTSGRWPYDYKP